MTTNITTCFSDIVAQLTDQGIIHPISMKMKSLTDNETRVLFVYDVIASLNAFPCPIDVQKQNKISIYYRNLGNTAFQKRGYYEAWQYYNLSLMNSPLNGENYCLTLSNRSAVFFFLNKYKECMQDIEKLFSLDYPSKLKEKLVKRQELCIAKLAEQEEPMSDENKAKIEQILSLKVPRDKKYPCASSKLEVVCNKKMGRHVIAKEDINVGEVLVQEDPYFSLLLTSQLLFACSNCLSRKMNLYPCHHCCFSLYCSDECREKAWKDYHSVECLLLATMLKMQFTKLELLALRTVLKARNDHESWDSLYETIKKAEENMNTEYHGLVEVNDQWIYDSKYYASIHTLESNLAHRSLSDMFQKSVSAAMFLHLLIFNSDFLKPQTVEEFKKMRGCVAGALLLHMMTSPTNMHGLSSNAETEEGNYVQEISIASAPYAYHSLLNHSCAPNVVRFSKLGSSQMTLFALRPIKKGEQLFDNYGAHHAVQDLAARQQFLSFQYKFKCVCEACVHDWPTYTNILCTNNLPAHIRKQKDILINTTTIEKLQKADVDSALQLFQPLCNLAQELEPYGPCMELADCQEALKQCLVIFHGVVPHGQTHEVKWDTIVHV